MTVPQGNTWSAWQLIGRLLIVSFVVLFVVFGLALLAFSIFTLMAFNNYGSNK